MGILIPLLCCAGLAAFLTYKLFPFAKEIMKARMKIDFGVDCE